MLLTKKEITRETLTLEVAGMFGELDNRAKAFINSQRKTIVFLKNPQKNIMVIEGAKIVYVISADDKQFNWYRVGNYVFADIVTVRDSKTHEILKIKS